MSQCLTEEQLQNLAAGGLPEAEAGPLQDHLKQCPSCQQLLSECRENLAFMTTFTQAVTGDDQTSESSRVTDSVAGYEIKREIHRGAQGIIYQAIQLSTSAEVAIKFLREGMHASATNRRRFEREIELIATLKHPNIINIIDSGISPAGRHYYVMNFVEGCPLHEYIWDNQLPVEKALELFIDVCSAINYAHQRGVIHRDLKPSNILVDAEGVPKVLDFGLAKHIFDAHETLLSMTGQVMGTLPYMSPEQARGSSDEIDTRTDVYALGMILYKILTGQYPYPVTGTVPEVLNHITDTPATAPSKVWTKEAGIVRRVVRELRYRKECPINEELDTIVLRALTKEPDRRYPSVAAFMDDISRYLHGQPIEAKRDIWIYQLRKRLIRYKAATALAFVCVVLTAAFAFTTRQMYHNLKRQQQTIIHSQELLVTTLTNLGDNELHQGDVQKASTHYWDALVTAKQLFTSDSNNSEYRVFCSNCYRGLGNTDKNNGNLQQAEENYTMALDFLKPAVAADPDNTEYQAKLSQIRDLLAEVRKSQEPSQSSSTSPQ
ncbi:MAG: protein kinase domain-containing protein [Planctomycetota bacterium]|jgi:serine/threonine-protein kinase